MRTPWCWVVAVIVAAQVAAGQDLAALRAELATVDAQVRQAREQAAKSPQLEGLRATLAQAARAYEEAVARIPEVKATEAELVEVRARTAELVNARQSAIEANGQALAPVRQGKEAAETAFHRAMQGGEAGQALLKRRQELRAQLAKLQASVAVAAPASENPATR